MKQAILAHDRQVPRYTSYPTAPHFQSGLSVDTYQSLLKELPADSSISLYVHVPFCPKLCWFCGCNTKITQRYSPVEDYLELLHKEIRMLGSIIGHQHKVTHLHFGGGSPTIINGSDFTKLVQEIRKQFRFKPHAEMAIEIDPRNVDEARICAYAAAGINRVSFGIQDFDQKVMTAVNRTQPYEISKQAIDWCRQYGIDKINIDLIYGLPHQTLDTARACAEQALTLEPDRIALFGYAHVPWMKKHMRLLPEDALPLPPERLELFEAQAEIFEAAGYAPIGIDHFAKPDDALSHAIINKALHRNFQGYTNDPAAHMIGLGVSAIGRVNSCYVQNSPYMPHYRELLLEDRYPVEKFFHLSAEDKLRADVIEQLMCQFQCNIPELCVRHCFPADHLNGVFKALAPLAQDGLITCDEYGTVKILVRQGARLACACFDTYLQASAQAAQRHVTAA